MTTTGFASFVIRSSGLALPGLSERNVDATLYVGNIDSRVDEESLWELFVQCGPLTSVSLPRDRITSSHHGFAFVEFKSADDADFALRCLNMIRLYGKPIRCNKSSNAEKTNRGTDNGANLFVSGLASDVDEAYLADAFSSFGQVIFAKIMRDPETMISKGFGFVALDSFINADRAISAMDSQYLMNKAISVSYANKKDSNESHGSGAERLMAGLQKPPTTFSIPRQPGSLNAPPHQFM